MAAFYGARFADAWRGIDPAAMKACWSEELAAYSGEEIAAGVRALKTREWPPTLPEFLKLCRPDTQPRIEWAEACDQMRIRLEGKGADRWSRPQVYWAAVAIGAYDLQMVAWEQIRSRWEKALAEAKATPIPDYRAQLPAPGRQSTTREEAASRLDAIRARAETKPQTCRVWKVAGVQIEADKVWVVRLLQRVQNREQLSAYQSECVRAALPFLTSLEGIEITFTDHVTEGEPA